MKKMNKRELLDMAEQEMQENENIYEDKHSPKSSNESFSIDNIEKGVSGYTYSGEELEKGMSYSDKMLDINELMEEGVVLRGEKIDLANYPNVVVVQAASQEQFDMLTPESKAQIASVHLSNDTPVGWNGNYDFHNFQKMDERLDFTDFPNLKSVKTHFYVNDSLEKIYLPESVEDMLIKHSQMSYLKEIDNIEQLDEIFVTRSSVENLPDHKCVLTDERYSEERQRLENILAKESVSLQEILDNDFHTSSVSNTLIYTPLSAEKTKLLLDACPNIPTRAINSALIYQTKSAEKAKLLIEAGANVNAENTTGLMVTQSLSRSLSPADFKEVQSFITQMEKNKLEQEQYKMNVQKIQRLRERLHTTEKETAEPEKTVSEKEQPSVSKPLQNSFIDSKHKDY